MFTKTLPPSPAWWPAPRRQIPPPPLVGPRQQRLRQLQRVPTTPPTGLMLVAAATVAQQLVLQPWRGRWYFNQRLRRAGQPAVQKLCKPAPRPSRPGSLLRLGLATVYGGQSAGSSRSIRARTTATALRPRWSSSQSGGRGTPVAVEGAAAPLERRLFPLTSYPAGVAPFHQNVVLPPLLRGSPPPRFAGRISRPRPLS
jgi:hypothetical protein